MRRSRVFAVTVVFEVKKEAIEAFREAVVQQANNSLTKEAGCRRFDVCFDAARPERVFLYELYDDGAAFDRHRETDHFARFNKTAEPLVEEKRVETWQLYTPA
jgi:(4S)-4-hydroxy-5-phosphonooxypentane-2,3-dione isomerase